MGRRFTATLLTRPTHAKNNIEENLNKVKVQIFKQARAVLGSISTFLLGRMWDALETRPTYIPQITKSGSSLGCWLVDDDWRGCTEQQKRISAEFTWGVAMQIDAQFAAQAQQWANTLLMWVGFGTIVGLLAKAIMPGRDPGGAVATLAMGIGGTVIGCGTVSFFYRDQIITPISPLGLCVATAGAFIILFFYRLLAGYWFVEGDRVPGTIRPQARRRRRRYLPSDLEETLR